MQFDSPCRQHTNLRISACSLAPSAYSLLLAASCVLSRALQCFLSSIVGRDAVVCALTSCPAALNQLVCLLRSRDKVLKAAAGGEMQEEAANELVSIRLQQQSLLKL